MRLSTLLPFLLALSCASSQSPAPTTVPTGPAPRLTLHAAGTMQPGIITMYVSAAEADGKAMPGLDLQSFAVLEDGEPVPLRKAHATLLPPEPYTTRATVIMLDVGGMLQAGKDVKPVADAALALAERLRKRHEQVAVYGFAGAQEVTPIAGFGAKDLRGGMAALGTLKPPATRTGSYKQAALEGVRVARTQLETSSRPARSGVVVVFTDGSEKMPAPVNTEPLIQEAAAGSIAVDVIAVGPGASEADVATMKPGWRFVSAAEGDLAKAFDAAAAEIEARLDSLYVVSFCSPSRKGEHRAELRLEKGTSYGATHAYQADGFNRSCRPVPKPRLAPVAPPVAPK